MSFDTQYHQHLKGMRFIPVSPDLVPAKQRMYAELQLKILEDERFSSWMDAATGRWFLYNTRDRRYFIGVEP
jgi:hypothetical protein